MEFQGNSMKIAQVSATFPPYMGGTGNVCYHNSLELAKLGHEVTVITSRYPDEEYEYSDSIKVVRFKPLFRLGNAPLIPKLMTLEKFDIVHLHYPFIFGSELILLNTIFKKSALVVTYHQDLIFNGLLSYPANIYNLVVSDRVFSRAKKILTPSLDHLFNSQVKYIAEKRKAELLELPNGVDTKIFNPYIDCNDIRRMYNLVDKKVVLFVGALDKAHHFKGVTILIEAFSKIKLQETVLMVVGDGELKQNYQNLANKIGLSNRVVFTGRVSEHDLPKYYSISDLLVLPSISSSEVFGMVLIEAMACGKPVIATNLPGVRTVVDDGNNGYLIAPENVNDLASKIEYLLQNKDISKKFGEQGRKKVEKYYSWEKIGKKLERAYFEILGV